MTLNFAELLCTENKEQPSQQLKQGSSDSPVQLSLHKVLICGYSNNFLIVCCHWDRQGIDTLHSLAVITQQCRNSAEHVKGNQPLAQLNSSSPKSGGENPILTSARRNSALTESASTWLRGSVLPTHLIHNTGVADVVVTLHDKAQQHQWTQDTERKCPHFEG